MVAVCALRVARVSYRSACGARGPKGLVFFLVPSCLCGETGRAAVALGVAVAAVLPTLVTLLREGRELSTSILLQYLDLIGLGRVFLTPVRTGVHYFQYVEIGGLIGPGAIRPLTWLIDVPYVNVAREVGLRYIGTGVESVLANANFLFAYYAAFGMGAVLLSIVGVYLLDAFTLFLAEAPTAVVPLLVLLLLKSAALSETVLTTALLTGGFLLIPVLAFWARSTGPTNPIDPSALPSDPLASRSPVDP